MAIGNGLNLSARKSFSNWDIYIRYNFTHNSVWAITSEYCKLANPKIRTLKTSVSDKTPDNTFYTFACSPDLLKNGFEIIKSKRPAILTIDSKDLLKQQILLLFKHQEKTYA